MWKGREQGEVKGKRIRDRGTGEAKRIRGDIGKEAARRCIFQDWYLARFFNTFKLNLLASHGLYDEV